MRHCVAESIYASGSNALSLSLPYALVILACRQGHLIQRRDVYEVVYTRNLPQLITPWIFRSQAYFRTIVPLVTRFPQKAIVDFELQLCLRHLQQGARRNATRLASLRRLDSSMQRE